nr:immunoglobulin heavy chain junction region [Macaca mulatta]MOX92783.1 immunoglobulin heavy chain junction region [Macaca mulatta]MOX93221.1 immunoglobulin heavy chain junction region [Macaca mulatta]MOX93247.1 immunoglobulin heavy chain junction region [Macaca mulatta]MOX93322.1 immunoglobulin heavy chain junction region [Macaca mulatta]
CARHWGAGTRHHFDYW